MKYSLSHILLIVALGLASIVLRAQVPPDPDWLLDEMRANKTLPYDTVADYTTLVNDATERELEIDNFMTEAMAIAEATGNKVNIANIALCRSIFHNTFHRNSEDPKISILNAERACRLYRETGNLVMASRADYSLSGYFTDVYKHHLAEGLALGALKIWQDSADIKLGGVRMGDRLAKGLLRVLYIYDEMDQPDKVLEYFEKVLPYLRPEDWDLHLRVLEYSGEAYLHKKDYYRTIAAINEMEQKYQDSINFISLSDLRLGYSTRGEAWYALGEPDKALVDFKRAARMSTEYDGDPYGEDRRSSLNLAFFYANQGQETKALFHLKQYEAYTIDFGKIPDIRALKLLKQHSAETGDLATALQYGDRILELQSKRDSIRIISLEGARLIEYETAEKEARILAQEEALSNSRRQLYFSLGGLALSILLGLAFFALSNRLRRQNAENEKLVFEKETLIGEIHHRVKNNLQVISSLLQLQSRGLAPDDHKAKDALRESQSRVQAMGLIHQKLYQGEEVTSVPMPDYLKELGKILLAAYHADDRIEIYYDIEDLSLDVDTAIPLGLIINELVTNSLKYAYPDGREGTIEVALYREEGQVLLRVSDDGVGASGPAVSAGGTGFGTNLVELLSQKLKGRKRRVDGPGYGTEIVF